MKTPIRVAVSGNSGSGRTSLAQRLNEYNYNRAEDGQAFQITAKECDLEADLFPGFDLAIFTFSVENFNTDDVRNVWQPLSDIVSKNHADHYSRICFVGTKIDLVVPGTRADVNVRFLPSFIKFVARVDVLWVSTVSDAGLANIVSWIATRKAPLPVIQKYRPKFNLHCTKDRILDAIASLFALPVPKNVNQDTPDPIEIADDDAVDTMCKNPELMEYNKKNGLKFFGKAGSWSTYLVSPTLIAKRRYPTEWGNVTFCRSKLQIPIPQPRYPHLEYWYVEDYIPGRMLLECWDSLSFFMKFRIACTLRGYISQLKGLKRDMPGSVIGGNIIGHVFSTFLGYNGPFRSIHRFNQFVKAAAYLGWADSVFYYIANKERGLIEDSFPPPQEPDVPADDENTLVFTHTDISLSNLLLTDDGTLWVIDWVDSGFYPPWMESIGMHRYQEPPKSWKRFLWLIVGRPPPQQSFWSYVHESAGNFSDLEPRNKFI